MTNGILDIQVGDSPGIETSGYGDKPITDTMLDAGVQALVDSECLDPRRTTSDRDTVREIYEAMTEAEEHG